MTARTLDLHQWHAHSPASLLMHQPATALLSLSLAYQRWRLRPVHVQQPLFPDPVHELWPPHSCIPLPRLIGRCHGCMLWAVDGTALSRCCSPRMARCEGLAHCGQISGPGNWLRMECVSVQGGQCVSRMCRGNGSLFGMSWRCLLCVCMTRRKCVSRMCGLVSRVGVSWLCMWRISLRGCMFRKVDVSWHRRGLLLKLMWSRGWRRQVIVLLTGLRLCCGLPCVVCCCTHACAGDARCLQRWIESIWIYEGLASRLGLAGRLGMPVGILGSWLC